MSKLDVIIGSNLKFLRQQFNYSQEEICGLLNISQPAYSKYEAGETTVNQEALEKLSELYYVDEYDLMQADKANLTPALLYAFRGTTDVDAIAGFHKIIKNYIQMCDELNKEERN